MSLELNKVSVSTLERRVLSNNFWKKICVIFCQKSFRIVCSENLLISLWTLRSRKISTLINSVSLKFIYIKDTKFLL